MGRKKRSLEGGRDRVNAALPGWTALEDLLRSLTGEGEHETGLDLLALCLRDTLGCDGVAILVEEAEHIRVGGASGLETMPERAGLLEYGRQVARWIARTEEPIRIDRADPRFADPPEGMEGLEAIPLMSSGEFLGAMLLLGPIAGDGRDEGGNAAVALLSRLASLALERIRIRAGTLELRARVEDMEKQLMSLRRLAAVGELATEMAREIKSPLAGMGAIAARISGELEAADPRRAMLDIIVQEAGRLDRILDEQLDLAASPEPARQPEALNRLLGEALMLASDDLRAKRIRITKRLAAGLPALVLDPDLMRRIFLNMLRAGLESASPGGRVKIQTLRRGDRVEVLVATDGKREPGRALDQLWRPFRTDEGPGADIMASSVQKILQVHRAVMRVSTSPEWPLVFSLVLPIPGNQERRRVERRGFPDRRQA